MPCHCIAPIVTDEVGRYCPKCGKGYEAQFAPPTPIPREWIDWAESVRVAVGDFVKATAALPAVAVDADDEPQKPETD